MPPRSVWHRCIRPTRHHRTPFSADNNCEHCDKLHCGMDSTFDLRFLRDLQFLPFRYPSLATFASRCNRLQACFRDTNRSHRFSGTCHLRFATESFGWYPDARTTRSRHGRCSLGGLGVRTRILAKTRVTKRCNRAAKSSVLKWLIFRRRRLIVTVIREMHSVTSEIETWIQSTQFDADGYFVPTGFGRTVTLYQTPVEWSFVLALIDGSGKAASFSDGTGRSQYQQLIAAVRSVTNDQQAYWFYGYDPDNALSVLSWVRENNYEYATEWNLNSFETSPAPEGGVSWLGLVASDKQWMLLLEHNPCNDFKITFHGTADLCALVTQLLNCG